MRRVLPETFGAVGDGVADDSDALATALDALRGGDTLTLTGRYRHDATLPIVVHNVLVNGGGELIGTTPASCALQIDADNVTIEDLRLTVLGAERQGTPASASLLVGGSGPAAGFSARRLQIRNSGVMVNFGSHHFILEDLLVVDTWADGIHMTGGAHDGLVSRPCVINSHDDGVAIVSYTSDPTPCHDITVRSPRVHSVQHGRGLSVVGGERIAFYDIDVNQTSGAGVYVACENNSDWHTYAPIDVQVVGGVIIASNLTSPRPDHAAVYVVNEDPTRSIRNVRISGLTIRDVYSIYRAVGFGGVHVGCSLSNIVLSGLCPRIIVDVTGGDVKKTNLRVGITQFNPHPIERWLENPNGQLAGGHGSTAGLLNGSWWFKTTSNSRTGWQQVMLH